MTHLASLAASRSSLTLVVCSVVWLTIPSILLMLERLPFICAIILSRTVLFSGSVIDKTSWATFSMLSGSAPSSGQYKRGQGQKECKCRKHQVTFRLWSNIIHIPVRKFLIFSMNSVRFLLLSLSSLLNLLAFSSVFIVWFFRFFVIAAMSWSWTQGIKSQVKEIFHSYEAKLRILWAPFWRLSAAPYWQCSHCL